MLERTDPLRFYDNDHDPDFTEQRHIDMALERAEYETTTSPSKQEICTTKELWWQYPADGRTQRSQTRNGEAKQAPLVLSHEIQASLRRDRQFSGAKRLGTGSVLRVTSLLPTQTSTDEKSTQQQQNLNVAVSNSSFAHVKKALSKKAANKPATSSLGDLNVMISPRSDVIVVDYKLGNAGFFDWTKVSSKNSSSEKKTSSITQRCKSMMTRSSSRSLKNLKSSSSSSSSQKLQYSSPLYSGDHPICPKSSKCELSIRLPNVNFAHKPPSTNQSSRRPPSKEHTKSKSGNNSGHACGQMVFNKCDFQPTLTLSKGFPKALQL